MINAAVISKEFCSLLLNNPAHAMASGYHGESFSLTPYEEKLVLSIRATSLNEFAVQLMRRTGHQ